MFPASFSLNNVPLDNVEAWRTVQEEPAIVFNPASGRLECRWYGSPTTGPFVVQLTPQQLRLIIVAACRVEALRFAIQAEAVAQHRRETGE